MGASKRTQDGVLSDQSRQGILMFGESPLLVGQGGIRPRLLAQLKVREEEAGNIGIALGFLRPAQKDIFWPQGLTRGAARTKFIDEFALGPASDCEIDPDREAVRFQARRMN